MAIRTKTIQNVSQQAIDILHQKGDVDNTAGSIPYSTTGMMKLMPGTSTTIEEARIDIGQLQNFKNKGLIKIIDGLV